MEQKMATERCSSEASKWTMIEQNWEGNEEANEQKRVIEILKADLKLFGSQV